MSQQRDPSVTNAGPLQEEIAPAHEDLDAQIAHFIQCYTSRKRHFDGTLITPEMREVWRQGSHVQVREFLARLLEPIVRRSVYRAWRKDVVPEYAPWQRVGKSILRRAGGEAYDLSQAEDRRESQADFTFEFATAYESALDKLNQREREQVDAYFYDTLTIDGIAAKHEVTPRTVYRTIKKFREEFAKAWYKGGI
jgi:RNA polymerase sigma factor (sigma-70 family)